VVAHAKSSEAAVVGYPHDIKGQGIYAYVTLMAGTEPSEELRKELVGVGARRTSDRSPLRTRFSSRRVCRKPAPARSCAASCARSPRTNREASATPRRWRTPPWSTIWCDTARTRRGRGPKRFEARRKRRSRMLRSDISAFTRVFDALCMRRGVATDPGSILHATLSPRSSWIPVLRRTAEEALRRARDTNPDAALTPLSVPRGRCGTFTEECCFQVIYFVSNISIVAAAEPSPRPPWKAFGNARG